MKSTDAVSFAEALVAMGEMYGKEITVSLSRMYFDDLQEYPLDRVLGAMAKHRKDSDRGRFFPKVADLIDKLETKRVTYETSKHPALVAERILALVKKD